MDEILKKKKLKKVRKLIMIFKKNQINVLEEDLFNADEINYDKVDF